MDRVTRFLGPALAAAAVLLSAAPAAAHNTLQKSDPADGATLRRAPASVTLTFNEPAQRLGTRVLVTGADGTVVSAGDPELTGRSVVQPLLETLPDGAYRVVYRVTSKDGHPVDGEFGFRLRAATATTTTTAADSTTAADADTPTPTPVTPTAVTTTATSATASQDAGPGAAAAVLGAVGILGAVAAGGVLVTRTRRPTRE